MYRILRKVKRHEPISPEERQTLLKGIEGLFTAPNAGWRYFFTYYARELAQFYHIELPLFACDPDMVYDWLLQNPALLEQLAAGSLTQKDYPPEMADYLLYIYGPEIKPEAVAPLLNSL